MRAPPADPSALPEAAAVAAEARAALLRALDALEDEAREVVVCRQLLDLSVEETAAALGIALGTVKSRQHRALQRLRVLLEPVNG